MRTAPARDRLLSPLTKPPGETPASPGAEPAAGPEGDLGVGGGGGAEPSREGPTAEPVQGRGGPVTTGPGQGGDGAGGPIGELLGGEGSGGQGPGGEALGGEEASGGAGGGTDATPQAPEFAADSVWDEPLGPQALIDPQSPLIVQALDAVVEEELSRKVGPWLTHSGFTTPIYTVPADQPTVRVLLENNNPALQQAFDAVPLPADAQPDSGTDGQLTVWQPSSDRLWEFWRMRQEAGQWRSPWGGAIEHVSQSRGYFSAQSWPGARSNWGASATSLPLAGGLITLADLERGEIDHALAFGYPLTESGVFRFPAQRTDGKSSGPDALPEGTRLRIDPGVDLDALHLPALTLMIARAAQRYGIVLRDTSGVVDFFAQDAAPTGTEPYAAWLEGKKPWQLLARFPWAYLEALGAPECSAQPCAPPTGLELPGV